MTCPMCGATEPRQMYLDNFCDARCCGGHPCIDPWHRWPTEEPEPGSPEYDAQTDAFLRAIGVEEPER